MVPKPVFSRAKWRALPGLRRVVRTWQDIAVGGRPVWEMINYVSGILSFCG